MVSSVIRFNLRGVFKIVIVWFAIGLTLGLGLGQINIVGIIISLQQTEINRR